MIRKATSSRASRSSRACARRGPGQYEHELDGVGKFVFWRNGAQGDAYFSLIASGHNAYWPHYNAGKRKMEDGDFLLLDYAPDYGYYMSDVTRMFPVNGKFSPWQRELYGFYLACYRAILKAIAPGPTAAGHHAGGRERHGKDPRRREVHEARRTERPPKTSSRTTRSAARASTRTSATGSAWPRTTTARTAGR